MKHKRHIQTLLGSLFAAAVILGQAQVTAQGTGGPAGQIPSAASAPGEEVTSLPIVVDEPTGWLSLVGSPLELAMIFRGAFVGDSGQIRILPHGTTYEIRIRGDVNLSLDRAALAASSVRIALHSDARFEAARAWVRYGSSPIFSLADGSASGLALPNRFTEQPGRRAEFSFGAVTEEGAYHGVVAQVRGDRVLLAQRTGLGF